MKSLFIIKWRSKDEAVCFRSSAEPTDLDINDPDMSDMLIFTAPPAGFLARVLYMQLCGSCITQYWFLSPGQNRHA